MWSTDVLSKLHESLRKLPELHMEKYKYAVRFLRKQLGKHSSLTIKNMHKNNSLPFF